MKIIVNGVEKPFLGDRLSISYEDLAAMGGCDPKHNPTIVYHKAHAPFDSGTVVPGDRVTVKHGTVVNVAVTGAA